MLRTSGRRGALTSEGAIRLRACGGFFARTAGCVWLQGLRLNMANTPKKVKDPTEVALSAIQEALNISDSAADTSRNASMRNETAPAVAPPAPPVFDEPSFEPRPAANERAVFEPIEEPRAR